MASIALALKAGKREGVCLDIPYLGLRSLGAVPRMGQLTMIVAPPGGCKTAFVTDLVLSQPRPTLYFSADGDKGTVGVRVLSCASGMTTDQAEEMIDENDQQAFDLLDKKAGHIDFCFESELTPDIIVDQIEAYGIRHGAWPEVIVVDNLSDVSSGGGITDDWKGLADTATALRNLASELGPAVILLHHVSGQYANGIDPIPLSAVLGQVTKPQRLIYAISRPADDKIHVSVVKNSNGPARADGSLGVTLDIDLERMYFGGK